MLLAAAPAVCDPPPGVEQIPPSPARFIVIGETHGTEQAPAVTAEIACALARDGEKLLVAVELTSSGDAALQRAWRGSPTQFASGVRSLAEWPTRQDGVASTAMLAMLTRLHALKVAGREIGLVAFNGTREQERAAHLASLPGQGPHEAAQAENIRRAADAGGYDRVLVLVGNLHARKRPVASRGVTFDPMARRLAPADKVMSLKAVNAGGTMWNCLLDQNFKLQPGQAVPSEAIKCGAHPTRGFPGLSGPVRILSPAAAGGAYDPDYDGVLWLGRVTASAPDGASVSKESR